MSADNGGPAFPFNEIRDGQVWDQSSGVTVRDWLAGKALGGIIAAMSDNDVRDMMIVNAAESGRSPKRQVAFAAYEYADEMLAERAK